MERLFLKTYLSILLVIYPLISNAYIDVQGYSETERKTRITLGEDFKMLVEHQAKTTITHYKGLTHANINIKLSKFTEIDYFEAVAIHYESGKTLKKVRLKDLKERDLTNDEDFIGDTREKYFEFDALKLPFIVQVSYGIKWEGNFFIPSWMLYDHTHQKVMQHQLEVIYPNHLGIRYKALNFSGFSETVVSESHTTLFWKLEDSLLPLGDEYQLELLPQVKLAPSWFSLEGYDGNMDTWANFGNWLNLLNEGKEVLPETTKDMIRSLVEGIEDPYEKVNVLYRHLQKNYRYVSVQLGIGGWMPTAAADVVDAKYGDCKGLTILMQAMLKAAGIRSQYTLVKSGVGHGFDSDFPSNQFNHVILKVHLPEEVIWLECTSKTLPAGYLGKSTWNKDVLVLYKEEGGKLEKTPAFDSINYYKTESSNEIHLDVLGNGQIKGWQYHTGEKANLLVELVHYLDEKKSKEILSKVFFSNGLVIDTYNIDLGQEKNVPVANLSYGGMLPKIIQMTARRVLIPINLFPIFPDDWEGRYFQYHETTNIYFPFSILPEEELPNITVDDEFYKFSLKSKIENNQLTIEKIISIDNQVQLDKDFQKEKLLTVKGYLTKLLIFTKQQ